MSFSLTARTRAIKTLLFDWDGTLNDSADNGFRAFEKSLQYFDVAFDRAFYDSHYSPNWYTMYEALRLPREHWQRADNLWIEHYGTAQSQLIPGAKETLIELHGRGFRLGIVSSGSDCRVVRELKEHELEPLFDVVVCNEQMTNKKPHPEGLEHAMHLLNVEPEACAYIGDVPEDIEMGRNARVLTIGVKSEYPSSRRLASARPDIHLKTIDELRLYF